MVMANEPDLESASGAPGEEPRWARFYRRDLPAILPRPVAPDVPAMVRAAAAKFSPYDAFTLCLPDGATASLTFAETDRFSDQFAVFLREKLKLKRGDRVAVQLPNDLAYPVAAFGVLKAACVVVNVNPLYTPSEMAYQFRDSGARVLVIDETQAGKLGEALESTGVEHVVTVDQAAFFPSLARMARRLVNRFVDRPVAVGPVLDTPILQALRRGESAMRDRKTDPAAYVADLQPGETALLQYTGGTTGVSKGAQLTHGNLAWHATALSRFYEPKIQPGDETILTALPLYHVFAFATNLLCFHRCGARNVLVPSARPLANLKPAFEQFAVTWMTGVNTLYAGLIKEQWFLSSPPLSVKVALSGGAAAHDAVAERWKELVGNPLYPGYGLTEASPTVTNTPVGHTGRPGSIGIPIPNMQVKIVRDDGAEAAVGEAGELHVAGPQIMSGYWRRPDETAQVLRDGWLATGDVAVMDVDGFLRIVDRKKDVIIVSGFNVYPAEIEECLSRMPGVREAAVIGVPHEPTGELVQAYVVSANGTLTAEAVREHCRKHLAPYKVPRAVEFRGELPKSSVGKILRRELRAEALAGPRRSVS